VGPKSTEASCTWLWQDRRRRRRGHSGLVEVVLQGPGHGQAAEGSRRYHGSTPERRMAPDLPQGLVGIVVQGIVEDVDRRKTLVIDVVFVVGGRRRHRRRFDIVVRRRRHRVGVDGHRQFVVAVAAVLRLHVGLFCFTFFSNTSDNVKSQLRSLYSIFLFFLPQMIGFFLGRQDLRHQSET